jgi:hypothetical protein
MTLHTTRPQDDLETNLIFIMSKVFRASFMASGSRQSGSAASDLAAPTLKGKMPLAEIKRHMNQCMHDMPGIEAERLRYKIAAARTVADLWLLRSDMYQTIAKLQNQSEAAVRINNLLVHFAHWLPTRQLVKI